LSRALRVAGYSPPSTAKGKASVDKDFLKDCDEVGKWLMEAREWHHLRSTYCKQIYDCAVRHGDNDWRVHTTTNQVRATDEQDGNGKKSGRGVRYGRTSCTQPSLQNQPIRNKRFGTLWRSIFVKKLGSEGWACSDWSQQEPRIGVHYAELLGLPGAKEFADEYRKNPALDVHSKLTELSGRPAEDRTIIKNYVNGRLYGMGDLKLCYQLGMPTEWTTIRGEYREIPGPECRDVIKQFRDFAPWIDGLTKKAAEAAKKNGVVWTWLRRRCNFPRKEDGTVDYAHKAFNRVGQGTAADQMKATLIAADAEGIPVDLIVHDEFDFSYHDLAQAKRLKELQMSVVKFSVPMKVDLEIGENWGELTKVAA
jgi:DNA polymerase-1